MSDVQTVGVLRDAFTLGLIALAMALVIYAWIRAKTGQCWNYQGNVLTRHYDYGDGLIALVLLTLFAMAFMHTGAPTPVTPVPETAAKSDPSSAIFGLVVNSLVMIGICIALLVYLRFFRELSPAELFGLRVMKPGLLAAPIVLVVMALYGWTSDAFPNVWLFVLTSLIVLTVLFRPKCIWGTAVGWAVVWLAGTVVMILFVMKGLSLAHHEWPKDAPQELVKEFSDSPSVLFRLVLAVTAVVIAPLTEEIIFRGFFYGIAKRFSDRWFASIITALMFALVHHNVGILLPLFVLAIGLAMAYEATGCLLVPMFMHAFFNAFNVIALAGS